MTLQLHKDTLREWDQISDQKCTDKLEILGNMVVAQTEVIELFQYVYVSGKCKIFVSIPVCFYFLQHVQFSPNGLLERAILGDLNCAKTNWIR